MPSPHPHTIRCATASVLAMALAPFLPLPHSVSAQQLTVDGVQSRLCIVIPEGTEGRVLTAAEDLATYLEAMFGAEVPLHWDTDRCAGFRLMIGSTLLAPVDPAEVSQEPVGYDGFLIRSVPGGVVIAGRNAQGSANGVYHFAEEVLGLHWYSLEDRSPTVPAISTLDLSHLDLTVKPDFAARSQYFTVANEYLSEEMLANRDAWIRFHRLGGMEMKHFHSFFYFVPDSLFAEHPEYFPLIDGERVAGHVHVQRCLSNPEVLQRAIEFTREMFRHRPQWRYTSLSANDGGGWCECDDCRALGPTPSHQILAFANAVAAANEELYPDRGYAFYAYEDTLEPPLDMTAHPNVLPVVALYGEALDRTGASGGGLCAIHPVHGDCPDAVYTRHVLSGWQQVAGRIGEYSYIFGGPFTGPGVITAAERRRLYRDSGSLGGMREQNAAPQANWAMLLWVDAQLWWDADRDPVALRRQFIEGYYGPAAADAVERIYAHLESALRASSTEIRTDSPYGHNHWTQDLLQPLLEDCRPDLAVALAAAQTQANPDYLRRVVRDMGRLFGEIPGGFSPLPEE